MNLTFNLLVNLGIEMFKLICIHCKLFSSASEQQGAEIMKYTHKNKLTGATENAAPKIIFSFSLKISDFDLSTEHKISWFVCLMEPF